MSVFIQLYKLNWVNIQQVTVVFSTMQKSDQSYCRYTGGSYFPVFSTNFNLTFAKNGLLFNIVFQLKTISDLKNWNLGEIDAEMAKYERCQAMINSNEFFRMSDSVKKQKLEDCMDDPDDCAV